MVTLHCSLGSKTNLEMDRLISEQANWSQSVYCELFACGISTLALIGMFHRHKMLIL